MKKNLFLILLIFIFLITATSCGKKSENNLHLTVYATHWASTDHMQAPEEEFYFDNLKVNEKYVVEEGSFVLTFTVTEINENSIVIKTTEPFSEGENGINLNSNQKEFTIERGGQIKLTTPSMDAGGIYKLRLY